MQELLQSVRRNVLSQNGRASKLEKTVWLCRKESSFAFGKTELPADHVPFVQVVERELQHPGRHVHLLAVLVQHLEQDADDSGREALEVPLRELRVLFGRLSWTSVSAGKRGFQRRHERRCNTGKVHGSSQLFFKLLDIQRGAEKVVHTQEGPRHTPPVHNPAVLRRFSTNTRLNFRRISVNCGVAKYPSGTIPSPMHVRARLAPFECFAEDVDGPLLALPPDELGPLVLVDGVGLGRDGSVHDLPRQLHPLRERRLRDEVQRQEELTERGFNHSTTRANMLSDKGTF